MEPLTAGAIAIGTIIATKALEKTTEKGTDILLGKAGEFLVTLNKHSPQTVVAIEKAPTRTSDYDKAILEVESAVKEHPEVNQALQELIVAAQANGQFIQNIQKAINAAQYQTIDQSGSTFNV
jgi:hypothetical protein